MAEIKKQIEEQMIEQEINRSAKQSIGKEAQKNIDSGSGGDKENPIKQALDPLGPTE